jgi:hypothetical protein
MWEGKVKGILESEKYTTLMVNELFLKLKSSKVDQGLTARLIPIVLLSSVAK